MATAPTLDNHGDLMDSVYRWQRHIYDATRKYFLFGRDRLIRGLRIPYGGAILEIGCGTGRNLSLVRALWPKTQIHGLDISPLMLETAADRLGGRARLELGDACDFNAPALFGRPHFERVMISFALSMIPAWEDAMAQAIAVLAPGGELHIVDFGEARGLPTPLRWALMRWLAHFHVSPRTELLDVARHLAGSIASVETHDGPLGYYRMIIIRRYTGT